MITAENMENKLYSSQEAVADKSDLGVLSVELAHLYNRLIVQAVFITCSFATWWINCNKQNKGKAILSKLKS